MNWRRAVRRCLALASITWAAAGYAYDADTHQQLTFLAAKHFSTCVSETESQALSPLQVRNVAKANVAIAQSGVFRRGLRWTYYAPLGVDDSALFGLIETRFGGRYVKVVEALVEAPDQATELTQLGKLVHYLQEATSPAHVVPVYTSRWWRFNVGDRFDERTIDEARVQTLLDGSCFDPLSELDLVGLLNQTAERTRGAVDSSIPGLPVTWQAFWSFSDEEGEFGEYGDAGNRFGLKTEFDCGESRCVLLEDDPLYDEFAAAQHALAVRATAHAMLIARQQRSQNADDPRETPLGAEGHEQ